MIFIVLNIFIKILEKILRYLLQFLIYSANCNCNCGLRQMFKKSRKMKNGVYRLYGEELIIKAIFIHSYKKKMLSGFLT